MHRFNLAAISVAALALCLLSVQSSRAQQASQLAPQTTAKPVPLAFDFKASAQSHWFLQANPETSGSVTVAADERNHEVATVDIEHFDRATGAYLNGHYWADMTRAGGVADLSPYKTAHFRARGEGLAKVRLRLASGCDEWISTAVQLSQDWKDYLIPLDSFYHNVLVDNVWVTVDGGSEMRPPSRVSILSFQVGEYVNDDIRDHGHADISDFRFEAPESGGGIPPAPPVIDFTTAPWSQWTLMVNPESKASLDFEKGADGSSFATLGVERFVGTDGSYLHGQYWVEMSTIDGAKDLSKCKTINFFARGEGLTKVRFTVWLHDKDSWISPPAALSDSWQEFHIPLDHFAHLRYLDGLWKDIGGGYSERVPDIVSQMTFQIGQHVNDNASAHGHVDLSNVRFL